MGQTAPAGARAANLRKAVPATGGKVQTFRLGLKAGGVGHGSHLNRRLGAVQKGIEHSRIELASGHLRLVESIVFPDRVRRGGVIPRQVLGPLAGTHHLEPTASGPIHQFTDQRRLVPIGQAVDDACPPGSPGQQGTCHHIGLHVDHDQVLAVLDGLQGVTDPRDRIARGFHDDIHTLCR